MNDGEILINREELYRQVWNEPMTKLAKRYGLSDVGLAKICRKMGIPLPGRGYWAKVNAGRIPKKTRLPNLKKGQINEVILNKISEAINNSQTLTEVEILAAAEEESANRIVVQEVLTDPHNLIERTAKSLRGAKPNKRSLVQPKAKGCLDVTVNKESIERAMRIMDALIKALEKRGYDIAVDTDKKLTQITIMEETLDIGLEELPNRIPHEMTDSEKRRVARDSWYRYQIADYDYLPSGRLKLMIKGIYLHGLRGSWADGKVQRLENCLNKYIAGLIRVASLVKEKRLERERQEKEWEEARRRREVLYEQQQQEQERVNNLLEQASNWSKAKEIRAFITASSGIHSLNTDYGVENIGSPEWREWAIQQADRLDPLTESLPSVLDNIIEKPYWY